MSRLTNSAIREHQLVFQATKQLPLLLHRPVPQEVLHVLPLIDLLRLLLVRDAQHI